MDRPVGLAGKGVLAGLLVVATDFAIMERHRVTQTRATPYQFICCIFQIRPILH